jgi:hypothetical protein
MAENSKSKVVQFHLGSSQQPASPSSQVFKRFFGWNISVES